MGNIVVSMQSTEETRSSMLEFRRLIEKMREWNDASAASQNAGPIHPYMQVLSGRERTHDSGLRCLTAGTALTISPSLFWRLRLPDARRSEILPTKLGYALPVFRPAHTLRNHFARSLLLPGHRPPRPNLVRAWTSTRHNAHIATITQRLTRSKQSAGACAYACA